MILRLFLAGAMVWTLWSSVPCRSEEPDTVVLADFELRGATQPLDGWKKRRGRGRMAYTIEQEGQRSFLRVESEAGFGLLYKRHEWDPREYPFLSWEWSPRRLPANGREDRSETRDSGASLYVVFDHSSLLLGPRTVRYVWSSTLPVGKSFANPKNKNVRDIVLRSGPADSPGWLAECRNVLDDYRKLFKEDPPKILGVAVGTDSDNTRSSAIAGYDGFRLLSATAHSSETQALGPS